MAMYHMVIIYTIIRISTRKRRVMGIAPAVERGIVAMRRSSLIIQTTATRLPLARIRTKFWIKYIVD